ncbi:MAG: hypothetical protein ACRBCT_03305 [Alphaproteobacteria bacterium]
MSSILSRRDIVLGGLSLAASQTFPPNAAAQATNYTIRNYPFRPDGIFAPIKYIHNDELINMDVGLLHPQTGGATMGFYAALDPNHGEAFSPAWKQFYQRHFGNRSVHDTDRGKLIQFAQHIGGHGIQPNQMHEAYNRLKATWDQKPDLRLSRIEQPRELEKHYT